MLFRSMVAFNSSMTPACSVAPSARDFDAFSTSDVDRLLANPPEKVEIEVKYKIAVTVMELRFWLKECELPI